MEKLLKDSLKSVALTVNPLMTNGVAWDPINNTNERVLRGSLYTRVFNFVDKQSLSIVLLFIVMMIIKTACLTN